MKKMILAAVAALTLGMGAAYAQVGHQLPPNQQQGNSYNFVQGGGG